MADAKRYIKIFTALSKEEIDALTAEHEAAPHLRVLPVAYHGDNMALLLQLAYYRFLILRKYLSNSLIYSHLRTNGFRRRLVITCYHQHTQAHCLQLADSLPARRLYGIGNSNTA